MDPRFPSEVAPDTAHYLDGVKSKMLAEIEANKRASAEKNKSHMTGMKYVKYGVMIWALRLGFVSLGLLTSSIGAILQYMLPSSGFKASNYMKALPRYEWGEVLSSQYKIVADIRSSSMPAVINNIPVPSSLSLVSTFQKHVHITSLSGKVSKNPHFAYFGNDREWALSFPGLKISRSTYKHHSMKDVLYNIFDYRPAADILNVLSGLLVLDSDSEVSAESIGSSNSNSGDSRGGSGSCECNRVVKSEDGESASSLYASCRTEEACSEPPLAAIATADKEQYLYFVHPDVHQYQTLLVPALSGFIAAQNEPQTPQMSLWIASENVSARMHYDLEDNFLLQLTGNKTVTIISPEGFVLLQTASSLDPFWRQSQHACDVNTVAVTEAAVAVATAAAVHNDDRNTAAAPGSSKSETSDTRKKIPSDANMAASSRVSFPTSNNAETGSVPDTTCTVLLDKISHHLNRDKNQTEGGGVHMWEISLQPGDLLHIPAGFLHSVSTGPNSMSMNMWFRSSITDAHSSLSNVPLPFNVKGDTLTHQLSALTGTIKIVLREFKIDQHIFASSMLSRYSLLLSDPVFHIKNGDGDAKAKEEDEEEEQQQQQGGGGGGGGGAAAPLLLCSDISIRIAESKPNTRRAGMSMHSLLSYAHLRPSLLSLTIMDYVEEVLLLIGKEHLRRQAVGNMYDKHTGHKKSDADIAAATTAAAAEHVGTFITPQFCALFVQQCMDLTVSHV